MSFQSVLLVGVGGFFGTLARYFTSLMLGSPYSTLLVNILGSFLIGWVLGQGADRWGLTTTTALTVGVLGGFTTFSAFSNETVQMLRSGQASQAFIYVALTLILGFAATYVGFYLTEG